MDSAIEKQFKKLGVRVEIAKTLGPMRFRVSDLPIQIDIQRDRDGEYFEITHRRDVEIQVVDVQPNDRHLLLMARVPAGGKHMTKSKYLCGHDERSWFVAAIPESARARGVQDAKDALKPQEVWNAMREHNVPLAQRDRRRTAAFVRQGEWFFIPRPRLEVDEKGVLKNEPIRRGAGKPHMCQFLYRDGGERVHVCSSYPNGLTDLEFSALDPRDRQRWDWRLMTRDAKAYVRGTVRHPDHATITLEGWHEVVMNTETRSRAMQNVAFLD